MRFVPRPISTVVLGDDARLMARLATVMARKRFYLPLVDGPRIGRPDADHEVIRRTNVAVTLKAEQVILVGLPEATHQLCAAHLPAQMTSSIGSVEIADLEQGARFSSTLNWGKDKIGLGLLVALRQRQLIQFNDSRESPGTAVGAEESHIVVCEEGDEHAQVLAANYAYSLGAGLQLLPAFPDDEAESILESLYSVHETPGEGGVGATRERVKTRLRDHMSELQFGRGVTVTFVTRKLPWGFALSEHPSTHLFWTDLGLRLAYGVFYEQPDSPGIRSALVIDPAEVSSKEIDPALHRLTENGAVCKALRGRRATVHQVAHSVRLFPYDFLLVSTHCGDAPGHRETYEFTDSEGHDRRLVVDVAVSFQIIRREEDVKVTEFVRFVSLDGVDWNDRAAKRALYVGTAIKDFSSRSKDEKFEPVHRGNVPRVRSSMALKMADGIFIMLPEAIASRNSPIVFNNACGSWHRLAGDFMFSGARGYLGTLFSVMDGEVEQIIDRLFGRYYAKDLTLSVWRAQNDVYREQVRRPFVFCGCHFQRLLTHEARGTRNLTFVIAEVAAAIADWRGDYARLTAAQKLSEAKTVRGFVEFLASELTTFREFAAGRVANAYYRRRR